VVIFTRLVPWCAQHSSGTSQTQESVGQAWEQYATKTDYGYTGLDDRNEEGC
jgi:hypothetical protein